MLNNAKICRLIFCIFLIVFPFLKVWSQSQEKLFASSPIICTWTQAIKFDVGQSNGFRLSNVFMLMLGSAYDRPVYVNYKNICKTDSKDNKKIRCHYEGLRVDLNISTDSDQATVATGNINISGKKADFSCNTEVEFKKRLAN